MSAIAEISEVQTFEIRKQQQIDAPIEIVFGAMLDELGSAMTLPHGQPMAMKIEPWPGGRWFRDLGNNNGHWWGTVQVIKRPTLLEITGPMAMSYPATNHVQYKLKAEAGGTLLTLLHRSMGMISQEHLEGFPVGSEHIIQRIRESAERKHKETK